MFTCMPGNVRALPIAKWQTGGEGRWDKTIPAEAALSLVGSIDSGLGAFGGQEQSAAGDAGPNPNPSGFRFE